jgi:predicted transposase YbfD/YdcC
MHEVSIEQLSSLKETCQHIEDPRTPINILHPVQNIVIIAIAAILAGAEGPKSIARWAQTKRDWLATWLDLPEGKVPSRDCFRTFFGRVKPVLFQACFVGWIQSRSDLGLVQDEGLTIAIDGKTLRHSYDTATDQKPLHLVSAWVAEHHLCLGQVATEEKSNEITAIPELLDQIDIQGAIVTIDAMGCQKKIASQISEQEGDFVIAVKGNQPTLFETIQSFFDSHWENKDWSRGACHRHHTCELHGNSQVDRYYYVALIPRRETVFQDWPTVKAIGMAISVRQTGEEITEEVRYYILSAYLSGQAFAQAARQHWSIENNCHWQLDVLFGEDASRVRERTLANNLSWLRRVAISLLKRHPIKDSLKGKREMAGWSEDFLAEVLQIKG